jgi:hypothetical protein
MSAKLRIVGKHQHDCEIFLNDVKLSRVQSLILDMDVEYRPVVFIKLIPEEFDIDLSELDAEVG